MVTVEKPRCGCAGNPSGSRSFRSVRVGSNGVKLCLWWTSSTNGSAAAPKVACSMMGCTRPPTWSATHADASGRPSRSRTNCVAPPHTGHTGSRAGTDAAATDRGLASAAVEAAVSAEAVEPRRRCRRLGPAARNGAGAKPAAAPSRLRRVDRMTFGCGVSESACGRLSLRRVPPVPPQHGSARLGGAGWRSTLDGTTNDVERGPTSGKRTGLAVGSAHPYPAAGPASLLPLTNSRNAAAWRRLHLRALEGCPLSSV